MYSNKLYTPLRYPGGKARFAPLIADVIERNALAGGHYLEPYAGGAGVALVLLMDGLVERIHINDVDEAIAVFWRTATQQVSQLIEMVANEAVTMEAWHHWRAIMLGQIEGTELERGFATLFMNRTNRSGILKAGVIGGKSQSGKYKLDARFMRDELCLRLERIGHHAESISVYEEDAYSLLRRCHSFLPTNSLIYLDPPYYVKGAGLYRNFYKHDDHEKIARLLGSNRFRRPWIVSYDNTEEICEMYSYAHSFTYGLNYTAQRRYTGSEVMFFSDRLTPPDTEQAAISA
ncbi:MAG: DNA adenine methylase [Kerstersia gyiorum]|jgi:DNA adenine methylase|uniref:DNA adenine methylase n=1 Tax=Kerstersia gyiorum TaxID=206506 RepID=UPI00242B54A5|nr:DNA adenine methylase [Kerstersia gyiorum]MCH4272608.1 DNA adenine methylase [Kerstersia gyiorum]